MPDDLIAGRPLRVTHPDKVMFPATGTTKRAVIDYYLQVAPYLIPLAADRLVTRKRWVNGVGTAESPGQVFFRKDLEDGAPNWVPRVKYRHQTSTNTYPLASEPAVLAWFGQVAALELHVPQWQILDDGTRQNPDRFVLDLDPGPGAGLVQCVEVAFACRELLDDMGLESVPVTSGSKGVHLYAKLDGSVTSEDASAVAKELAQAIETQLPDLAVSNMRKDLRGGKVLIDWSQNSAAKTTVCPYSLRGRPRPMVAAPRTWDELGESGLKHLSFRQVLDRLEQGIDPMESFGRAPSIVSDHPASEPDKLAVYRSKRDPGRTPEPVPLVSARVGSGGVGGGLGGIARRFALIKTGKTKDDANWLLQLTNEQPNAGKRVESVALPRPMLAKRATPGAGEWCYEMKWDGVRAICGVSAGGIRVSSRNSNDVSATYPELQELAHLAAQGVIVDGEIVALNERGVPDFGVLQRRMKLTNTASVSTERAKTPIYYMVFDILADEAGPTVNLTYDKRRERLIQKVQPGSHIMIPPAHGSDREAAFAVSKEFGLEGVIAKRTNSKYTPDARSDAWLKIKHERHQEVVVIGWRPSEKESGLASVIVGVPNENGELRYAGRVGTRFSDRERDEALERLKKLERKTAPIAGIPREITRDAHWVRPELVGEVRFTEFTRDGVLRHPAWRGWRPDKTASQVEIEG